VIGGLTRVKWKEPLAAAEDPIAAMIEIIESSSRDLIELGCPLANITQEMSPLDEGFRSRTVSIFKEWHDAVADALRRGQAKGLVRPDLEADDEAMFLIAAFEGYLSLAKNSRDPETLRAGQRRLARHLQSLRIPAGDRQ
jgi:TetR/AcrR family transcriptional repressor of nem operon